MSDEGTGAEGTGAEGTGAEGTEVTFGSVLPADMMGEDGKYPAALDDFSGMVIPGADVNNEEHQAFHQKLGSLAKAYSDTKSMVGTMMKVPGSDATPEEIAAFRGKMGVPATAEDYDIKTPEVTNQSVIFSPEVLKSFQDKALEAGLSNEDRKSVV